MIVNIYGRHPSICHADPTPCDVSIGINEIPMPCDWLCFGDELALHRLADGSWRLPLVGSVCPASFEHVHPVPKLGPCRTWASLRPPFRARKSAVMALLAAIRFGASEIRTWGIRMNGERDFDGTSSADNALHGAAARWVREREAWNRMVAYGKLATGVSVIRH